MTPYPVPWHPAPQSNTNFHTRVVWYTSPGTGRYLLGRRFKRGQHGRPDQARIKARMLPWCPAAQRAGRESAARHSCARPFCETVTIPYPITSVHARNGSAAYGFVLVCTRSRSRFGSVLSEKALTIVPHTSWHTPFQRIRIGNDCFSVQADVCLRPCELRPHSRCLRSPAAPAVHLSSDGASEQHCDRCRRAERKRDRHWLCRVYLN